MLDMEILTDWYVLGGIVAVLLLFFFRGRNAVWGGFTAGLVLGLGLAIFFVFRGEGFEWSTLGKSAIIGTLIGFAAELLGKLGNRLK